jgi:uncharacterized protein
LTISTLLNRHPISFYFILTFATSWFLAFLVVSPSILAGRPLSYFSGVIMFPVMLAGPSIVGLVMTRTVDGRMGLKDLFDRMRKWRMGRWYVPAILVPPTLILATLYTLSVFVSPVFVPNFFIFGFGFGVIAGFLEEIGWTGYAIRKLSAKYSTLTSALILGALWGLWHAPVVDFLGAAYPHGPYWLPFFLSFIAVVMAVRVLIVWLYSNTGSVAIAQVMHMSSTGFLATLAPVAVSPAQEAGWYATYAALLWIVVLAFVVRVYGKRLTRQGITKTTDAGSSLAGRVSTNNAESR